MLPVTRIDFCYLWWWKVLIWNTSASMSVLEIPKEINSIPLGKHLAVFLPKAFRCLPAISSALGMKGPGTGVIRLCTELKFHELCLWPSISCPHPFRTSQRPVLSLLLHASCCPSDLQPHPLPWVAPLPKGLTWLHYPLGLSLFQNRVKISHP